MEKPRIVGSRSAYSGWNRLDIVTVEAPDQSGAVTRYEREVVDHGEGAVVLAVDRARGVAILVRQWRAPLLVSGVDPFLLEACAGIIDPGETPEVAARREAEEELGLTIGAIRKIAAVLPSAGTLTERMHLFVADVTVAHRTDDGGGDPDEGENIEVVEIALAELYDLARRGAIDDAKTLILVQHLLIEDLQRKRPGG